MKIVVCIKQVPDSANIRLDPVTHTLKREGVAAVVNPFDMHALEAALRLREMLGEGTVTALTMGPAQASEVLREALRRGADEGVLLCDRAFAGSDTFATSYVLSQAIRKMGDVDIVVFGKQASDGDTAQVGPGVATHLDLPQITCVRKLVEVGPDTLVAERMLEDGSETIRTTLPCVLTVVREVGDPRLPSLRRMMSAKHAELTTWTAADIDADVSRCGLKGSPTHVVRVFSPPVREATAERLLGDAETQAESLVDRLFDRLPRG